MLIRSRWLPAGLIRLDFMMPIWISVLMMSLMAWPLPGHAQHAHVHGQARLGVAVDGGTLLIELDAPLESLVGFEHAPRNARQREAMAVMQARLNQAGSLWRPNPEARCVAGAHEVNVHHDEGHADVAAHVSYQCARPEALRHLDIELWQAFGRLKTLSVSVALPRVQFTRRLARQGDGVSGQGGRGVQPSRLSLLPPRSR